MRCRVPMYAYPSGPVCPQYRRSWPAARRAAWQLYALLNRGRPQQFIAFHVHYWRLLNQRRRPAVGELCSRPLAGSSPAPAEFTALLTRPPDKLERNGSRPLAAANGLGSTPRCLSGIFCIDKDVHESFRQGKLYR